jgi:hypothetical protein
MFEYRLDDLALVLGSIISSSRDLKTSDSLSQPICDDEYCKALGTSLDALAIVCGNFNSDPSLVKQINALSQSLLILSADRREAVLFAQLRTIIQGIQSNLESRKFMFMPSDQAEYWDNLELFGDDFMISFPAAAIEEMRESGNCFAAGRWTAAVFHCMRVAEYGLRRLARNLKVTISHKGKICPIEYGDWNTVITAVRNKIIEVRKLPNSPKKEHNIQFYSNAADRCEYMKDIWRNEISHARRRYSKSESLAVINRVRDFVQPFAATEAKRKIKKRLREAQKSPRLDNLQNLVSLRDLLSPAPNK